MSVLSFLNVAIVSAQKVDAEGLLKKIEKNDAAIADAKKSQKAALWLERGDLYYKAANEPIKSIYLGGSVSMLVLSCGEGKSGTATVNNRQFSTLEYPYFTVYLDGNKVVAWTMNKEIKEGALDVALEAYEMAFKMDFETLPKVEVGLSSIMNYHRQMGNGYNSLGEVKLCVDAYTKANEIQNMELYPDDVDPMLCFFAGYMHVVNASSDPASYPLAEQLLNEAIAAGYCAIDDAKEGVKESEKGAIYYYLFHCAYGQSKENPEKMQDAKQYLIDGMTLYPRNENIFDGLLQLYTTEEGMGDPTDLLANAEENIKADPNSVNAWYGKGRIYYAVKDYDNAIVAFEKVLELDPKMAIAQFYMGLFYMHKADLIYNEIKDVSYTNRAKYDEDIARLNGAYALSIPCFEAAYELDPSDRSTISYLKQLCFRLRDEPGMMEKYTKYNDIYEAL